MKINTYRGCGEEFAKLIKELNLSNGEISKMFGISKPLIYQWISNQCGIRCEYLDKLREMAKASDVQFLSEEDIVEDESAVVHIRNTIGKTEKQERLTQIIKSAEKMRTSFPAKSSEVTLFEIFVSWFKKKNCLLYIEHDVFSLSEKIIVLLKNGSRFFLPEDCAVFVGKSDVEFIYCDSKESKHFSASFKILQILEIFSGACAENEMKAFFEKKNVLKFDKIRKKGAK